MVPWDVVRQPSAAAVAADKRQKDEYAARRKAEAKQAEGDGEEGDAECGPEGVAEGGPASGDESGHEEVGQDEDTGIDAEQAAGSEDQGAGLGLGAMPIAQGVAVPRERGRVRPVAQAWVGRFT